MRLLYLELIVMLATSTVFHSLRLHDKIKDQEVGLVSQWSRKNQEKAAWLVKQYKYRNR